MTDLNEKILILKDKHHGSIDKILEGCSHPLAMVELLDKILSNDNLSLDDKDNILKYIYEALGDGQAYYTAYVGAHSKMANKELIEAVKITSKAKGEDQAYHAADIIVDDDMAKRKEVLELAWAVSQSLGKYQAYYGSKVAKDKNVIASGHVIPLTVITCGTEEYYQAERTAMVCLNPDLINNDNILFYADVVSRSKNLADAKESSFIATNNFMDSHNKELALRKIFK